MRLAHEGKSTSSSHLRLVSSQDDARRARVSRASNGISPFQDSVREVRIRQLAGAFVDEFLRPPSPERRSKLLDLQEQLYTEIRARSPEQVARMTWKLCS